MGPGVEGALCSCAPACLYNVRDDPSESVDVYSQVCLLHCVRCVRVLRWRVRTTLRNDLQHVGIVTRLADRLRSVGAAAPPPSSYWADAAGALAAICTAQDTTGFLEPVQIR